MGTVQVKHQFVDPGEDWADDDPIPGYPDITGKDIVRPSNWNADHEVVLDLDKSDVGLGNVDNTSDLNKPISTATQSALDGKSANSHDHSGTYLTPGEAALLYSVLGHGHGWSEITDKPTSFTPSTHAGTHLTGGGDTISNAAADAAGLMSSSDKTKLDGIASGAEVNVNADWNSGSGDSQILNKPTIPGVSGTTGYIPKFTDTDDIGNSIALEVSGKIGVTLSDPNWELDVKNDIGVRRCSNSVTGAGGRFYKARGTVETPLAVLQNDRLSVMSSYGYGATGWSGIRGRMTIVAAENWTDAEQGTYMSFYVTPVGGTTLTEVLVLTDTTLTLNGQAVVLTNDSRLVTNGNSHDHNGGDGAQINHTTLSNIGTNTHAQIDTFVSSKAAASGLASLNASSKVVEDPANATATPTASKIPIAEASGKLAAGWLPYEYGCVLSNNATDAANDLDISAGALLDSTGVRLMTLAAMTKRFDAAWAAGTGNGGMRSGLTKSANTWYFVYMIEDVGTAVDVIADTSNSGPSLPSGYDYWQLLGAFRTNAGSNILAFYQVGRWFCFSNYTETVVLNTGTPATSMTDLTLLSPPISNCEVEVYCQLQHASTPYSLLWRPNGNTGSGLLIGLAGVGQYNSAVGFVFPDSNGVIEYMMSGANVTLVITSQKFRLPRRGVL